MKKWSHASLDLLIEEARSSDRRRRHLNLHASYADTCQRLFNAIGVESYIRPHRHSRATGDETLVAIRGSFALLRFSETGEIVDVVRFTAESDDSEAGYIGVAVESGEWHTVLATESGSILLEVKAGPFDPQAAKEFAPWSPAEGSAEAVTYLRALHTAGLGSA